MTSEVSWRGMLIQTRTGVLLHFGLVFFFFANGIAQRVIHSAGLEIAGFILWLLRSCV